MTRIERVKVSFEAKEYGDAPIRHCVEVQPHGEFSFFSGESDTMYLELRSNSSADEAKQVANYLKERIAAIVILKF